MLDSNVTIARGDITVWDFAGNKQHHKDNRQIEAKSQTVVSPPAIESLKIDSSSLKQTNNNNNNNNNTHTHTHSSTKVS